MAALLVVSVLAALGPMPQVAAHELCDPADHLTHVDHGNCDGSDSDHGLHNPDLAVTNLVASTDANWTVADTVEVTVDYENVHVACDGDNTGCRAEADFNVTVLYTTDPITDLSAGSLAGNLSKFQLLDTTTHAGGLDGGASDSQTFSALIGDLAGVETGRTVTLVGVVDYNLTFGDWDAGEAGDVNETGHDNPDDAEVNIGPAVRFVVEPLPLTPSLALDDPADPADLAENMVATFRVDLDNGADFDLAEAFQVRILGPGGALEIAQPNQELSTEPVTFTGAIPADGGSVEVEVDTAGLVGEVELTVEVTYGVTDGAEVQNQATITSNATFTFHVPDFVPALTAPPPGDAAIPGGTADAQLDLAVTNEGDADTAAVNHGDLDVEVLGCQFLKGPSPCDPTIDGQWTLDFGLSTTLDATNLSAGETESRTRPWSPGSGDVGLFAFRAKADPEGNFTGEDATDNRAVTYVQSSTVHVAPTQAVQAVSAPGETVSYFVSVTNVGSTANTYAAFEHPAAAKHVCQPSCDDWTVEVLKADHTAVADGIFTVDLDPGETAAFRVNVTAPSAEAFRGGRSARVLTAVCEVQDAAQPTECIDAGSDLPGTGAVLTTEIPIVRDAAVTLLGTASRQAQPGDEVVFRLRVRNAGNVVDRFDVTPAFTPTSSTAATLNLTDGDGVPVDATPWLDPGAEARLVLTVGLDDDIADESVVEVNLTAASRSAVQNGTTAEALLRLVVGVGVDVVPPDIVSTPPDGAVFPPGTSLSYAITDDDAGVASVTVSVGDEPFRAFEAPYELDTSDRPDGPLVVRVKATDHQGNTADRTFRYAVDATPPRFLALIVEPGVAWAGGPVRVQASIDDPNLDAVEARIAGSNASLAFDEASGLWRGQLAAPSSPGLYRVRVDAVDLAGHEANRTRDLDVVLPDVAVRAGDVTVEPRVVEEGETVRVVVRVTNPSRAEIAGYDVALVVDGAEHDRKTVTLAGEGKTRVEFAWSGEPGRHEARVVADPDGRVQDANRDDNAHAFSLQVRGGGLLGVPGFESVITAVAVGLTALGLGLGPGRGRRRWDARDADEGHP